jgi:hypothetical protein
MAESPIPPGSDEALPEPKSRRGLPVWLISGLAIFLLLYMCGQFGIASGDYSAEATVESNLDAEYINWEPMHFVPVNPKIISEIFRDQPVQNILTFQSTPDCFFLGLPCEAEARSAASSPDEPTPTFLPTATETTLPTMQDSPTPTLAPTDTMVVYPTATVTEEERRQPDTATFTPSNTPTFTPIPPTPTNTPTAPVFTIIAPNTNQVEIGPPDGDYMSINRNNAIILDISANPIIVDETPNPDPDLVFYERENGNSNQVLLDLVIIQIGQSSTGEWFVVFNWGDDVPDGNTNIDSLTIDGEDDNEIILMEVDPPTPTPQLYGTPDLNTGITIDVDAKVSTPGAYDQIMIGAPTDANDPAEVDAIEVLPTETPSS